MLTVHANLRTRAGCWTCRARRKKCDETRPHCINCSNLRVPCQGYQVRLKWLPQHRLSAGRSYKCDDNPPKLPPIPSSGIPELGSKPLVYYLGVEGFDSLTDMAKRILQDFIDWSAAQLVSSVKSHSERYFEVFAGSKALVAGCIAFQVTLDLKYAPLVEQYYMQSVRQFRYDLAYPELVERKATIYAGLLLCSTSMMRGLPWTVHLYGISSILLERDVFMHLNEQTADFVPLIGVMDLPTHTLGRKTETLHIWYKHCRIQTGIDDCLGLPCSLVDLLCAVMEPGIIQRLLLWPSEHGTPEQHIMWDLTRYGGIIMAQNYQLENGLAQRQDSTVPEDVTVAFAVRHIITTAHQLRAEAGSLTRGLWSGLLFPLVAAASQPLSLADVDRSLMLDCITDLADGVLDSHPYYKQVIVVLQAFWEQKNTRSLQQVARDLNLEVGLF